MNTTPSYLGAYPIFEHQISSTSIFILLAQELDKAEILAALSALKSDWKTEFGVIPVLPYHYHLKIPGHRGALAIQLAKSIGVTAFTARLMEQSPGNSPQKEAQTPQRRSQLFRCTYLRIAVYRCLRGLVHIVPISCL